MLNVDAATRKIGISSNRGGSKAGHLDWVFGYVNALLKLNRRVIMEGDNKPWRHQVWNNKTDKLQ